MTDPAVLIEQPGPHDPGRAKCAAPRCPKTAAIRNMVRGPDGRLYGSSCARKLDLIPPAPPRAPAPPRPRTLNQLGAALRPPDTLFDQTKEQPVMPIPATSRRFVVERHSDPSGVSSTGTVLDGVLWPDGTVSVRWRGDDPSFVSWPSLEAAERKHCYGGHSRIVWIDQPADAAVDAAA